MEPLIIEFLSALAGRQLPYADLQRRRQDGRMLQLQTVIRGLLVNSDLAVQRLDSGDLLIRGAGGVTCPREDAYQAEAIRVIRLSRSMMLSVRQMYRLPRACPKRCLTQVRISLTPYTAEVVALRAGIITQRAGAVAPLAAVISAQLSLAVARGEFEIPPWHAELWVILCADATPLWRTSATRCDVHVVCWKGGPAAAGDPGKWATWWAMDGPDDAGCLRVMDTRGGLWSMVADVEATLTVQSGPISLRCKCFITGDGKGMEASNPKPRCKCWCCPADTSLQATLPDLECRWGAYLRTIMPARRVGDPVHCACRVANIFMKRLREAAPTWLDPGGSVRLLAADLLIIWQKLIDDALTIPAAERLAPRPTKKGTMDISTAKLFWSSRITQQAVCTVLERHCDNFRTASGVHVVSAVRVLLYSFSCIHTFWRKKQWLTLEGTKVYEGHVKKFAAAWGGLEWKVSTWVHWVCAHSAFYMARYRSMYIFSSIPTEFRNRPFKTSLKNSMRGWSLQKPRVTRRGMRHVVNMDALDVGLRAQQVEVGV